VRRRGWRQVWNPADSAWAGSKPAATRPRKAGPFPAGRGSITLGRPRSPARATNMETQPTRVLRHLEELTAARDAGRRPDRDLLESFSGGDEAAFASLVDRHGALVLGVCRRVLHNEQDAEDAFQATFLALARKAGAVGRRGALGCWLYRVA